VVSSMLIRQNPKGHYEIYVSLCYRKGEL
jgi:hypothetical protein